MRFQIYKISLILILCIGLISGTTFAQFETPSFITEHTYFFNDLFECKAGQDDVPDCYEILDLEAYLEQEDRLLIVPFAVKYDENTVTVLSAQIRSQRRGRTRLRETLNRNVKGLVREYGSPHLPLSSENTESCDSTCPEQEFLLKMRSKGYGNVFVSVTDYDGSDGELFMSLLLATMTPDMIYSGLIPEIDNNNRPIIRDGNIGTWATMLGVGKIVQRAAFTTIKSPTAKTTPFAMLVQLATATGIGVLSAVKTVHEIRTLDDNLRGLRYSNAQGQWIVYDSFYKVDFDRRKNQNRVFLDESSYLQ